MKLPFNYKTCYHLLNYLIAMVWFVNGLFCKILNLVPRHQLIVAKILGVQYSRQLTILIGLSEVIMAIWIVSGFKPRFNAYAQMVIVLSMNLLEFIFVPDLLLWGKFNLFFSVLFISMIYLNYTYLSKQND